MSDLRVCCVYFPPGPERRIDIARLMRVYWRSAEACGVTLQATCLDPSPRRAAHKWMDDNTVKLEAWRRLVEAADRPLVLTDCDMLMLNGDFSAAWDEDFDVAVTWRSRERRQIPMNGGVVFVRPSEAAREFMRRWCEANERMMRDTIFHSTWTARYAGINQAALGYLIETDQLGCRMHRFSCRDWNAVDEDWPHALAHGTRLVHIKGRLRQACLARPGSRQRLDMPDCAALIEHWDAYDRMATCVS